MRGRWFTQLVLAGLSGAGCSQAGDGASAEATPREPAFARGAQVFAPGAISDDRWQWRITFAPDDRVAYFSVSQGWFPATRTATIMRSERRPDGGWAPPEPAPFSGTYNDMDPFVTPDGGRLYFSSNRPVDGAPREAFDIWYVEREPEGWSEPVRLGPEVNTDSDELYPSATRAGTLYFASGPPAPSAEAGWNLYRSQPLGGRFAPREAVDGVNVTTVDPDDLTANWDFNPEISPDGRLLLFTSLRRGGLGYGDIYLSIRERGGWTPPRNLGAPVNTPDDEYHPTLSRDGRVLYFVRARLSPEVVPGDFHAVPVTWR